MHWTRRAVGGGLLAASVTAGETASAARRPIVIGHRGASGERPEHTPAAYRLAIAQGAAFIEPDLVVTKDGVLVCRHEPELSGTTDVASKPEFAARKTAKTLDGVRTEGWFAEDFTLAELKTLRCRERLPQVRPQNTVYDGQEAIPTFTECVAIAREGKVGVYPELKHPTDLLARGHDLVALTAAALKREGLDARDAPVFVQCFEVGPVQRLRKLTRARLGQLMSATGAPFDRPEMSYAQMATPAGLKAIAAYADGVGAEKGVIVPRDAEGRSKPPTHFVANAHAAGLTVHVWTFRSENMFLPAELRRGDPTDAAYMRSKGDIAAELRMFADLGVDGVFSDQPADAVRALAG